MSLRINTNVEAFNAYRNLSQTAMSLASSMQKLSSGLRINSAADDAAGLAISEGMIAQINGVAQATSNAHDGISLVQTADGALNEIHSILQRVRELAVQRSNGTLTTGDQANIDTEVTQLTAELVRIRDDTQFNGLTLFSATTAMTITFQVGANQTLDSANNTNRVGVSLGVLDFSAISAGDVASLDTAITSVSTVRANLGAEQNRLQDAITNLGTYQQNLSASNSQIRDVDVAQEMTNFTKLQILQQSGVAMLAQANQLSNTVLKLLG